MRLLASVGLCFLMAACCSASALAVAQLGQTPRSVVKGRLVAVDSGEPIGGVTVKIKGLGRTTTNNKGRYRIRGLFDAGSVWQVTLKKRGYRRRQTWLVASKSAGAIRADWNLLPTASDDFDVKLFDAASRHGLRGIGTSRWEAIPRFRIFANRLDCRGRLDPDESCPEWTVTGSPISSTIMEWMLSAIESVPALTGGMTPSVEIINLPGGTTISTADVLVSGAFTLGEYAGMGSGWFPRARLGSPIDGYVYLISEFGVNGTAHIVRRIAIGLGLVGAWAPSDLCADLWARGLRTVLCLQHGTTAATELDAVVGRALYTRAVGNQHADTDPRPSTDR